MGSKTVLDAETRTRLRKFSDVLYSNPFTDTRAQVAEIFGIDPPKPQPGRSAYLSTLEPLVEEFVGWLANRGITEIRGVSGSDATLLEHVYLFEIYSRYVRAFDELIERQLADRARLVPVPFADEAISALVNRGLSQAAAVRYFGFCYQVRRAYYFIVQALIGESPCMETFRQSLWNNVITHDIRFYQSHLLERMEDFSTLLVGETGTGKGAAAVAIGHSSFIPYDEKKGNFAEPFTETFLATNLSQFSESLIESELFGHRKGAFTGAIDNHAGLFERCSDYGSLFLDEIGDVSVPVQIKLLKVLQERTFTPVGGHEEKRFLGRVIAATNRPLDDLRASGTFRDDFFYRLSSEVVTIPPLRQRVAESPAELERLTRSLLARLTGDADGSISDRVCETLKRDVDSDYPWSGNVRELEQAIRQILLTGRCAGRRPAFVDGIEPDVEERTLDAGTVLGRHCARLYDEIGSYEGVGRLVNLDRRTVRRYIEHYRSAT